MTDIPLSRPDPEVSRDQKLSFAVLGTGALGGLYGGLLAQAANDVHFLARSDIDHIRKVGLRVDSHLGNFHIAAPNVYSTPDDMPPVDIVIVAWKTTSNEALRTALPPLCRPGSLALVLQNGLNSEQDSVEVLGADRVLGGCCFLCSNKVGPGHIRHLDYGAIHFGEFSSELTGKVTERMQSISEVFRNAGIDMKPVENLAFARWKKLVWNIPFNGLSVVLNASTDKIMRDPKTCKLAEDLMVEVCESARANGISVEDEHVSKMLHATRKMVPYDSSMYLDYKAARPMEVESIFGNPLRAALDAGYRPRKIEMLYEELCFLDQQNLS